MSFLSKIGLWRKKVDKELVDRKREICLRLFRAIIYDTPVDEGTLRGNWQVSYNVPITSVTDDQSPNDILKTAQNILTNAKMSETIYFRNNMPYAYRIEYLGWSHTKAPQGMMRKNVARFREIARGAT